MFAAQAWRPEWVQSPEPTWKARYGSSTACNSSSGEAATCRSLQLTGWPAQPPRWAPGQREGLFQNMVDSTWGTNLRLVSELHTGICTYLHACIHTPAHTHIYAHIYIYAHTYIYTHHAHIYIFTHMLASIHTCIYTCTHLHPYTHTYTCTQMYHCIHAHIQTIQRAQLGRTKV